MFVHYLAVAVLLALFCSEAPSLFAQSWIGLDEAFIRVGEFELRVPKRWKMAKSIDNAVLLTRDGLWLQFVRFSETPVEEGLSFTRKNLTHRMLPEEVGEVVVDALRLNPRISNFHVLEAGEAEVAGKPVFRVVYSYRSETDITKKGIYLALLINDQYYSLQFQAPARHYFETARPVFEEIRESLRSSR